MPRAEGPLLLDDDLLLEGRDWGCGRPSGMLTAGPAPGRGAEPSMYSPWVAVDEAGAGPAPGRGPEPSRSRPSVGLDEVGAACAAAWAARRFLACLARALLVVPGLLPAAEVPLARGADSDAEVVEDACCSGSEA